jgi:biopolymer transport protein ExbD
MRRRPYPQFATSTSAPISDLNTTPLIDVMLVLLIMFIVTVPIATHKVEVDLPQRKPGTSQPVIYRLNLDDAGRLALNGVPVAEADLPRHLAAVKAEPDSELHFRTEGTARYEDFDRVLAAVKRAGITRLGLVDNQRFATFDR